MEYLSLDLSVTKILHLRDGLRFADGRRRQRAGMATGLPNMYKTDWMKALNQHLP